MDNESTCVFPYRITTNVYAFNLYLKDNCEQGWRTW